MSMCVGGSRPAAVRAVVTSVVVFCGLWFGVGVVRAWCCLVRGVCVFVGLGKLWGNL